MSKIRVFGAPALAALVVFGAHAQGLYKIVGPDGRVTYSDRPPGEAAGRVQSVSRETGRASDVQLPYALRQVATRFPVTLFTAGDCGDPCVQARSFLARRGIPYAERIAITSEDREQWERIVGSRETPTLLVGQQSLRSFSPAAWDETLDAAGYPRQSQLPANYQQAPATPLTPPRQAAAPPPRPAPVEPAGESPSGIRF